MGKYLTPLLALLPVPHRAVLGVLLRDNATENARDAWGRLRGVIDLGRYGVIDHYCKHFTPNPRVLDVGCSVGILQERLQYSSYTGIDLFEASIQRASAKSDARTRFVHADAATYLPDESYDAIIWNESLYYLQDPIGVIQRYRDYVRPGGIMVVSMFRTFATRRLFRQLQVLGPLLADLRLVNPVGGAWVLRAYAASPEKRLPSAHR